MPRGASAWLDVVILAELIKANAAHELIDWTAKLGDQPIALQINKSNKLDS